MQDLLTIAFSQYGVREKSGPIKNSPEILSYFDFIGQGWVKTDEMAWCAAYVNWALKKTGYKNSGKLNARSLLNIGKPVILPKLGDLAVLWRISKQSVYGHVGFFISQTPDKLYLLGGNQSNSVCIQHYPNYRLINFIRPEKIIT